MNELFIYLPEWHLRDVVKVLYILAVVLAVWFPHVIVEDSLNEKETRVENILGE